MKIIVSCVLLAFNLISPLSFAHSDECKGLPNFIAAETQSAGCHCGASLSNLKFTTPPGTKMVAACGLKWAVKQEPIDLNKASVTLNQSYKNDSIFGVIFLSGEIELSGRVKIIPTIASYKIAFYPKWSVSDRNNLKGLGAYNQLLFSIEYATDFHVDNDFVDPRECYVADARIRIGGFEVIMSEQDDNGTWPLAAKVLQISSWRKCKAIEKAEQP